MDIYMKKLLLLLGFVPLISFAQVTSGPITQPIPPSGRTESVFFELDPPTGTLCGVSNGTAVTYCKGYNPQVSCPTGYFQQAVVMSGVNHFFCIKN